MCLDRNVDAEGLPVMVVGCGSLVSADELLPLVLGTLLWTGEEDNFDCSSRMRSFQKLAYMDHDFRDANAALGELGVWLLVAVRR